jgi:arylsulfatase
VLTAVENVANLDASFWRHFANPDVGPKIASGKVRPDWTKRGFLRGYTDQRYTFGAIFHPSSPTGRKVSRSSSTATTWSCTTATMTPPR